MTSKPIRKIVDLSLELKTDMMVFPGDPPVSITPALTVSKDGVNVLQLHLGSQSGTHLDSPYHVDDSWMKLDELPLDRFLGEAVVVDATEYASERTEIPWSCFAKYEGKLRPGTIVLVKTGWSDDYFGTPKYMEHPYPSLEAVTNLVSVGILTIGLDFLSLDKTPPEGEPFELPNHKVFLKPGGVIVENLTNLEAIDQEGATCSVLPLKLGATDGAPVRAVAYWQ